MLVKEFNNEYDADAICAMDSYFEKIGYIANSVYTVGPGCFLASDFRTRFGSVTFGKVIFVEEKSILIQVKTFN
jgi:hypothetical protein